MRRHRFVAALWCALMWAFAATALAAVPRITAVEPPAGPASRPTHLIVRGENLDPAARVGLVSGGPFLVGRQSIPHENYDVALTGDLALVAFFDRFPKLGGFKLIDVHDPAAPHQVGSFAQIGAGHGVVVNGTIAYTTTWNPYESVSALRVVDIADPAHPLEIAVTYLQGANLQGLQLVGDKLYVAAGELGLAIYDVHDNTAPQLIGTSPALSFTIAAAVAGNLAYVADADAGVRIVDVSDPTAPVQISSIVVSDFAYRIAVGEGFAYVLDPAGGLYVIDVQDPAAPVLSTSLNLGGAPSGITRVGTRLFVGNGPAGLVILDAQQPAAPRVIGTYSPAAGVYASAVAVGGDHAHVVDYTGGLMLIDVSHPTTPSAIVATTPVASEARGVTLANGWLYAATGDGGVAIYDMPAGGAPIPRGAFDTPGFAQSVTVAGSTAFVADDWNGLVTLDVSDADSPQLLGSLYLPGAALKVAVRDGIAFVADDFGGLRIIDATEPGSLHELGYYDTPGRAFDVALAGDVAYVADYLRGVQVIDISDLTHPRLSATFDTDGRSVGLLIDGATLWVADDFGGLVALDVSTPNVPRRIGTLVTPGSATGLSFVPDAPHVLYVADGLRGLAIADAADPAHPALLASWATPDSAQGLAVARQGDVFIAGSLSGIVRLAPGPLVQDVHGAADGSIEATVPAGCIAGPYNVLVSRMDDATAEMLNGFSICFSRRLAAHLTPVTTEGFGTVQLPLAWRLTATEIDPGESRAKSARLLLPDLPADLAQESLAVPDASVSTIDLDLAPQLGRGRVRLAGSDLAALDALWARLRAAGGIALPELTTAPDTWGDVKLAVRAQASTSVGSVARKRPASRRVSRSADFVGSDVAVGSFPVHYHYEFAGDVLTVATASGPEVDLQFDVTAEGSAGCADGVRTSFNDTLLDLCRDLSDVAPNLVVLCPATAPATPRELPVRTGRAPRF